MIKTAKLQTTGVSQLMSLKTVHSSPQKQAGTILRCKCSDKHKQIWFCKGFLASDRVFTLKTINNSCLQRGLKLYTCLGDSVWRDKSFTS